MAFMSLRSTRLSGGMTDRKKPARPGGNRNKGTTGSPPADADSGGVVTCHSVSKVAPPSRSSTTDCGAGPSLTICERPSGPSPVTTRRMTTSDREAAGCAPPSLQAELREHRGAVSEHEHLGDLVIHDAGMG